MQTTQLNHVALSVRDVDASCEFYETVLGLEPIPRPAFDFPGAWYRLGDDQELHLIGGDRGAREVRNRANHYALMVPDMDEAERALAQRGATHSPRQIRPDGAFQIYLEDPDGHSIELCTEAGQADV